MKLELRADVAELVSELLHEYKEELAACDDEYASYCGEVIEKFDSALARAKTNVAKKHERTE